MIVVVTRNGLELTKQCLPTLLGQNHVGYPTVNTLRPEVLALDNHSTDGTFQYLRSILWNGYSYRRLVGAVPLAKVWNIALHQMMQQGVGKALIVNNDTELHQDTYRQLHNSPLWDDPAVGMVTGVSVRTKDELNQFNPTIHTHTFSPHPDFSCFMVSRECVEKVGLFDEQFLGAYCEDCDYHIRMHKAGVKALNCGVPFLHHASGTMKYADLAERNRIAKYAEDNRKRFFAKWGVWVGSEEYEQMFRSQWWR